MIFRPFNESLVLDVLRLISVHVQMGNNVFHSEEQNFITFQLSLRKHPLNCFTDSSLQRKLLPLLVEKIPLTFPLFQPYQVKHNFAFEGRNGRKFSVAREPRLLW